MGGGATTLARRPPPATVAARPPARIRASRTSGPAPIFTPVTPPYLAVSGLDTPMASYPDPAGLVCRYEPDRLLAPDSLLTSRLDQQVQGSAAARRDATAATVTPPRQRPPPPAPPQSDGAARPPPGAAGSPVAQTRAAGDRAAHDSNQAANASGAAPVAGPAGSAGDTGAAAHPQRAAGGGGSQRSEQRAKQEQAHEREQILLRLAQPPPHPITGGSGLSRESFSITPRIPAFPASRALPIRTEKRPTTGRDGKPLPQPALTPEAATQNFANAIATAETLYNQLIAAARELAAEAARDNLRSGDSLRTALDRDLARLDELHRERRISSDRAREFALERVAVLSRKMRRQIYGAAASAFARLARMRTVYEGLMGPPRTTRGQVTTDLSTALSETSTKANDAHFALQAFGIAPSSKLTTADFPGHQSAGDAVSRAKFEAALQFITPYITADDQATADRLTAIENMLNPMSQCLPCQMDGAFQLLDMRMDHLAVAGPKAVTASRDGALKAVDDLAARLRLTIEDTHGSIDRQLVAQHDRTRRDLIAQSQLDGQSERDDIRTTGSRQAEMLAAVAEGQARGVVDVQQRMARLAERGGGDYAGALSQAANRLRANVGVMKRRHPGEAKAAATAKRTGRDQRHGQIERMRARTITATAAGMADVVRSTFASLNAGTDKSFADMHDTPQRVRSSCEAFLGPAEAARNTEVANLVSAVNGIRDRVGAAIRGESAGGGGSGEPGGTSGQPEANVCTAEPNQSVAPPAASTSQAPPAANGGGQRMPPPASCASCPSAQHGEGGAAQPGTGESGAGNAPAGGTGNGPGATPAGNGQGNAPAQQTPSPTATSGGGDNFMSSVDFRSYCDTVTGDPKQASGTKGLIAKVNQEVPKKLGERSGEAYSALDHWRQPDTPKLMAALRGLTATSGQALQLVYGEHGDLRDRINKKYDDARDWTFSSLDTIEWNRRAALNALDGDVTGAAMNELRASFNYSNEDDRIRAIMGSLTPAQMAALPASELDDLARQLDGDDLARFNALRFAHSGGTSRAVVLRDQLDAAGRSEGDTRARAAQEAVRTAYNAEELAIEGDPTRAMADIFNLEHPDLKASRRAAHWHDTLQAFSGLQDVQAVLGRLPPAAAPTGATTGPAPIPRPGAPATGPPGQAPTGAVPPPAGTGGTAAPGSTQAEPAANPDRLLEDALIRYATRDIYHPPPPPPPRGAHSADFDTGDRRPGHTDRLAPDMVNWIEQSVRHGPDSVQARGAALLVEYNRAGARGSAERVDAVLHIGSADAREGGGYRPRPTDAADRERDRVFDEFARFQQSLGGESFIGPIDVRAVKAQIRERFNTALAADPAAQALATGIIDGEHGNPRAAIDYAIAHENTAMALRYLRRMDRHEIDALVEQWNHDYPNGPSLYRRLGIFDEHWSVTNWNGAVFSGDEANELELAFMGVPQNDRERAEVALRTMNQQIEQSTGLGRLLAGDEYDRMVANRDTLLRLIGKDNYELDYRGRLRVTDPFTGEALGLGNFDANGNFLPAHGRSASAFERAVALARYTATDFTTSVDAAANFFTTLLVVVAAVVTTALTGGAAASIWIPMLVTAAAGLAGVALTAAIKGGRYSRDEVVRDLIMVAVQTITAGIGAAGTVVARGGLPALKVVASQGIRSGFKISERALEQALLRKGVTLAATASLGAELGIGAASGAISGAATAALDPANRGEDFWSHVAGGAFRGAAGGAAGAGAARGVSAGIGAIGNRLGGAAADRAARSALASGLSREQAIERALLAARRASFVTAGVTRSIAGGASGSVSRMTELGLEGKMSFSEILAEGRSTFLQGAIQGALEHFVDPGHRNPFLRGNAKVGPAEFATMTDHQLREHFEMVERVMGQVDEHYGKARAPPERGPGPRPPAGGAAEPQEGTGPATGRGPAAEPGAAPGPEPAARLAPDGTISARLHEPGEQQRPAGARPELVEAPGPSPMRGTSPADEPIVMRMNRPGGEPPARAPPGIEEEPVVFRSNRKPGEPEQAAAPPRPRPEDEKTNPNIRMPTLEEQIHEVHARARPGVAEQEISPVYAIADLSQERLKALPHPVPEGSEIRASNPKSLDDALHNYRMLQQYTPHREVLLAYNPDNGHFLVVQGGPDSVKTPGSSWVTLRHSHPEVYEVTPGQAVVHHLPSGRPGDFSALSHEAAVQAGRPGNGGKAYLESVIDIHYAGKITETHFSVEHDQGQVKLRVRFRNPQTGAEEHLGPFTSIQKYSDEVFKITGERITVDESAAPGKYRAGEEAGVRRGDPVPVEQRNAARSVAERIAEAAGLEAPARAGRMAEIHEMVKALGLVGRPDSTARLTNLLNVHDEAFTPRMRSALAQATLEATRSELARSGGLVPGDDVVMLLRGVKGERMADYEKQGINLGHIKDSGNREDAGFGLYGSQDFESALLYAGRDGDGRVLPLIVRKSELGNILDVRTGTPLGDRWLQFIRANKMNVSIGMKPEHTHLRGVLFPELDHPLSLEGARRGERYRNFLKTLEDDPSLPPAVRAAAKDPHLTIMDLGGVASTGIDRGILTDQWALHSQHIADLFNAAHGFPIPTRGGGGGEPAEGGPSRSGAAPGEASGEVMRSNLPAKPRPAPASPAPAPIDAADIDPELLAMARPVSARHPEIAEINRMQESMANADPHGPRALIEQIKAGGEGAAKAQKDLLEMMGPSGPVKLLDLSDARLAAGFPEPDGTRQKQALLIDGVVVNLWRQRPTAKTPHPSIKWDMHIPPASEHGPTIVYQFGSGELLVWRTRPSSEHPNGQLIQKSVIKPGIERGGAEETLFSHSQSRKNVEGEKRPLSEGGYAGRRLERGHLHGPGLGVESPFGIGMVPREVNQILQNKGIERWLRQLRNALPKGATLLYSTDVEWIPSTMRHARIGYNVEIVINGKAHPVAEFAINIEADPPGAKRGDRRGTRKVWTETFDVRSWSDREAQFYIEHVHQMVDLPDVVLHGLPRDAPRKWQMGRTLGNQTPEMVERAIARSRAADYPHPSERLAGLRPPAGSAFRIDPFRESLDAALQAKPRARYIVVDTRGLDLSDYRLKQIEAAIAKLDEKQRWRIIRLQ